MGTTPNVGLMAQKAEEYGSHDKTFEIDARRHGARGRLAAARCCSSTTSRPATSGAPARPRTRRSRDWVRLAVERARATGSPAVFWLDETRAHDAAGAREGPRATCPSTTPTGCRSRSCRSREATRFTLERARARRGHDRGHRQRAARLPDRPVPDPRARHQREDALDRAADERRRAVRDRRRRLGAQARPAAASRRTTCAGTRSASSSRWPSRWRCSPTKTTTRARRCSARRSTRPPARCSRTASRRRARSASSTTAAATSTSRCYWAQELADSPRTPSWREAFAPLAERLAAEEEAIVVRARRRAGRRPSTSAATTTSTATRRRR